MTVSSPAPVITVVIPTHRPHAGRLQRTLAGLRAQTFAADRWELILVDNASTPPVAWPVAGEPLAALHRIEVEPVLGLTSARRHGLAAARGEIVILVDDDNVLAPDYLERVAGHFAVHPQLGALGGRSIAEYETPPPAWVREFEDLLACRDLGPAPLIAAFAGEYPLCAPIGAGMALRREAAAAWLRSGSVGLSDRRGGELSSGGDNDIVLTVLRAGWEVGYFPDLALTHLIPAGRTDPGYLARLNRGIAKSWMQVLTCHGINPWPPIPAWTVRLRQAKAWFTHRGWQHPVGHIRWQGACGHFEGRTPQRIPL